MYEQGKRQPDFEMQEAIADLFNVSIDYLFGRDEIQTQSDTLNIVDSYRKKAIELYELYSKASPEVQSAVELLLKAARQTPGSDQQT